ncbi:MAG: hypothetical protein COA44_13135 [Arcobacter sp.]|nr:MAG: hypothetical protein COA44_13135 [Arcobacter sp.]
MFSKAFKQKIQYLKPYKVYSNNSFQDIEEAALSVLVHRNIKEGKLIKVGKGKFYKRKKGELPIEGISLDPKKYLPSDKYSVRHNCIKPSKYPIAELLFYSNRNRAIPLDNYISKILDQDSIILAEFISRMFGKARVLEVYLDNFRSKGLVQENVEVLLGV